MIAQADNKQLLPQAPSPWVSESQPGFPIPEFRSSFFCRWCADHTLSLFAGISRSSRHKRSASGAQRAHYRKKRKFELGRQSANTKLGPKRIHAVRVRGGNHKYRALRLDSGNFAWGSEHVTRKTRIISVVRIFFVSFLAIPRMMFTWKRCIMLLTTSWSAPTLSSRVPSSRLMRRLFECGMRPTCVS